jgi:uncharacterized protein
MTDSGNNTREIQGKNINWMELIIFYIVAVLVSAPFRLNLIKPDELFPLPYGLNIFYHILRGIGPTVGFITVYYLLKSRVPRRLTFLGLNKYYSLFAIAVIPLSLTFAGVDNDSGLNENYFGFLTGVMLIFYALAEEYGWRGYLQQALSPVKVRYRIVLIALLWFIWHLNFLLPGFTVKTHLIFFMFLLLGSWGLMKISESTFSILFVAAVHLSFNVLSDVHADFNRKVIVLLFAAAIWTILITSLQRSKIKSSPKTISG